MYCVENLSLNSLEKHVQRLKLVRDFTQVGTFCSEGVCNREIYCAHPTPLDWSTVGDA